MSQFADVQSAIRAAQPIAFVGGTNLIRGDLSPKAIPCVCDFSAVGIPAQGYTIDATPFFQKRYILAVQTIFVDNSQNNGFVNVFNPVFNQNFALPPGWQGYFPVLAAGQSGGLFYVTSTGNQTATVLILNVAMPLSTWAATVTPVAAGTTLPVSDAILDATVSAGRQNVRTLAAQFTAVDRSGTIAVANTSQVLMAANAARQGFLLENIDGVNLEAIWISFVGPAVVGGVGSFSLAAAASLQYPGGSFQGVVSNQIQIIAATAGHKFSAMEW